MLLLTLAVPFLASCTVVVAGAPSPGVKFEKNAPSAAPPGLERFYSQQLGWEDCGPYATTATAQSQFKNRKSLECTRIEVPLDYAKPDGKVIKLGLLRQKASGERIGSLILNPGGPGASGMEAAASLSTSVRRTPVSEHFDLVGFDPRGVGASEPAVKCLSDTERDTDRLDNDVDTSSAGIAQTEAENKAFADKCAAKMGADVLANLGTRDVVKDLDVMRSVLGDTKLTYLGYSYGTAIGTAYAEAFPDNVRALVLDGAVDPTQTEAESLVAQGAGFQKAFEEFAAWCARRDDCALGKDVASASKTFRELTLPLVQNPIAVGDRKLSYGDAITGAIQAMYSNDLWTPLNTGLAELRGGKGDMLLTLADAYFGRDEDGRYSSITDAFTAIKCVDEPRLTDRTVLDDIARKYKAAAPFLDDGNPAVGALDACAFWPVPPTVTPHPPSVKGLPPVLVISTTGDPATPYDAGVNLAQALGGSLLTFEGNQHTVYLQGNSCVDPIGHAYLVDLTLPDKGKRCS
ncbi:alpha/beta hydrolase [Saccharothrix violaceirubra]